MSETEHIVFLDRGTLPPDIELRLPRCEHRFEKFDATAPEEVANRIARASVVVTNKVAIGRRDLAAAERLKLIVVAATGTDCVDIQACADRGVTVCNVRNYASATVPEHVFALALGLRRSIGAFHASVCRGRWQDANQFCYFDYPVSNLSGSVLGVIGAGALGQRVADLGAAFGMTVMLSGRKGADTEDGRRVPFDRVLSEADVISLHLPLTPQTRHLIGAREFALMEKRPILINTARGPLVDENALLDALNRGMISGAGIDVAMPEPPPVDGPLMQIARHPNAIVTPHIAWAGRQSVLTLVEQVGDLITAGLNGAPFNLVSPEN